MIASRENLFPKSVLHSASPRSNDSSQVALCINRVNVRFEVVYRLKYLTTGLGGSALILSCVKA
jgi:hypothetical protein